MHTIAPAGLLFPSDPRPQAGLNANYHYFAPPASFAYDVLGDGATGVRGGGGMLYDLPPANTMSKRIGI